MSYAASTQPGPGGLCSLKADVSSDGSILVKGRGLLLAAGNGIGTNVGASVFATSFCGAAAPAAFNSTRVALNWTVTSEFKASCPPSSG